MVGRIYKYISASLFDTGKSKYLEFFKNHPVEKEAIEYIISSYKTGTPLDSVFEPQVSKYQINSIFSKLGGVTWEDLKRFLIDPFLKNNGIPDLEAKNLEKEVTQIIREGTRPELIDYFFVTLNSLNVEYNYSKWKKRLLNLSEGRGLYTKYAALRVSLRYLDMI